MPFIDPKGYRHNVRVHILCKHRMVEGLFYMIGITMTTATIWIEREDKDETLELEILVTGNYTPEVPARFSGHPDTWSPREGDEIELIEAECKISSLKHLFKDIDDLSSSEIELAKDAIRDQASDELEDAYVESSLSRRDEYDY